MTIAEFVAEVIPTNEVATATTKTDIRRIVAGTPIDWDAQDYTEQAVADYLWEHRAEYGQEDAE